MIVRIARVKVGNRQAPHARTPAQHRGGFAFYRPRRASSSSLHAFRSSAIPAARSLPAGPCSTLGAETLPRVSVRRRDPCSTASLHRFKKRTSLGSDSYFPQRGQVSAARSDHWHELNVGIAVAGQTKGPFRENALTFGSSIQSGAHREYRRGCKGIGR